MSKKTMIIKPRNPKMLELESLILKSLVTSNWSGEQIAGFISAQRRDGVLSYNTSQYQIDIEIAIWKKATPAHVRTQCQMPEVERIVKQIQYKWLCSECGTAARWDIEERSCDNCGSYHAHMGETKKTTLTEDSNDK